MEPIDGGGRAGRINAADDNGGQRRAHDEVVTVAMVRRWSRRAWLTVKPDATVDGCSGRGVLLLCSCSLGGQLCGGWQMVGFGWPCGCSGLLGGGAVRVVFRPAVSCRWLVDAVSDKQRQRQPLEWDGGRRLLGSGWAVAAMVSACDSLC
ncbi:hypothetical protein Dimus_002920 [Dionaea muscipula]